MMCIALYGNPSLSHEESTATWESHNVTCHPTLVNSSGLNPNQARWHSISLPQRDDGGVGGVA